ncbi:MAG: SPFH domain-containing protein [Candidatus Kapabacteria bacterium]|nr:SPFH domain-containing protein [Candidatus Kapabacteria bacterium]
MAEFVFVLALIALFAIIVILITISRLLLIAQPNEVVILSGRKRVLPDGKVVGYRIIRGGRALRIPFLEKAARMTLETIPLELSIQNAYSKGGIPLVVDAIANIKIDSKEPAFGNAVERFLKRTEAEIQKIAKETLEGNLRGVLASLTPEEVNEDRMKFAEVLMEEADIDLQKLGIQLDTLKITNISDERGYLDSIGRMKTAEVVANAKKAEADRRAEAEEAEALALKRAETAKALSKQEIETAQISANQIVAVNKAKADQLVEIENTNYRIKKAELEKEAVIKEKEALVAGQKAQAQFEQELEEKRIVLQQKKLTADIIEPAKAKREALELEARGAAASIIADGEARLDVLRQNLEAFSKAGENAGQTYTLVMLPQIIESLTNTIKGINIDKITLVDNGGEGGKGSFTNLVNQIPGSVAQLAETINTVTGVDILKAMKENNGD